MSETRDPAIKLFGKTIQLPEIQPSYSDDVTFDDEDDDGGLSEDLHFSPNSSHEAKDTNKSKVFSRTDLILLFKFQG